MPWRKGPNYLNILVLRGRVTRANPYFLSRLKCYLDRRRMYSRLVPLKPCKCIIGMS